MDEITLILCLMAAYIIVRKPQFDEYVPGAPARPLGNILYQGMNRSMWYDLDTFSIEGKLPDELKQPYAKLKDTGNYLTFVRIATSRQEAEQFFTIGGDWTDRNEVIVVQSDALDGTFGLAPLRAGSVEWLGFDLVLLGGWSLISHGIFENRRLSLLAKKSINGNGLFDDTYGLDAFIEEYMRLGALNEVDPLTSVTLEVVRVGRLPQP